MSMLSLHSGLILLGERLINGLLEGTLITLLVSVVFRLKVFRDSASRFAIWLGTMLAILALPLLGSAGAAKSLAASVAHVNVPAGWDVYALGVWMLISLIGILRIAIGLLRLRHLRLRASELKASELPVEAQSILEEFSSGRDVRICLSDQINAPTAVGFIHPAVLMPGWALSDLTGERLRSVLLHEVGHLRRWDDWTNLLQKVLRAVFFFHPAVWWIDSRMCLEREMACDDIVVAETNDAQSYAECLVSLAEKSMRRRGVALAVAAVGRVRQMTLRIGRILDQGSRRRAPLLATASLSVFGVLMIAASARLPMLVVFEDRVPSSSASANAVDMRRSNAANVEFTPVSAKQLRESVIPAVMKLSSAPQKSGLKMARPRAIRSGQRAVTIANPQLIRASINNWNAQPTLQSVYLLIIQTAQPDLSRVPEMVISRPLSTTIVCEMNSGTCTAITSSGAIQFTVYRTFGAPSTKFVANVI